MAAAASATAAAPRVIFVLGGPGAGKGTQCSNLVEEFDFVHLSAGDLLREERANAASQYGELISSYIKDGKIVPVEITVKLLLNAMNKSGRSAFLIDGFPRNADNLAGWERVVGKQAQVLGCLYFDCPEAVMEARLLERGKTSGRTDDNIESIRKRFKTYVSETKPIIDIFKQQGKCWHVIADRPVDTIRAEVSALIKKDTGMKPTKMGQVMKAVHAASDGAHALEGKAKEAVARVAHDVEELPRGVKLGLAVAFFSVLAFVAHRSLANK